MCSVLLLFCPSLSIREFEICDKIEKGESGKEADSKIDYLIVANYSTRRWRLSHAVYLDE